MCAGSLSSQLSQQRCGWADQWSGTDLVTTGSTLPLSSHLESAEQLKVVSNVCTSLADKAQDLQETLLCWKSTQTQRGRKEQTKCTSVGKSQVPHCHLPPQITDRKCSPRSLLTTSIYLSKSASRNPSPFIFTPLFM